MRGVRGIGMGTNVWSTCPLHASSSIGRNSLVAISKP